jgi:hypothetical protein
MSSQGRIVIRLLTAALVLLPVAMRAQSASDRPNVDRPIAADRSTDEPPYCPDLRHLAALATSRERFAAIAGEPRGGNFRDSSLALAGWTGCSLYGATAYTCDSRALDTAEQAEAAQSEILREIKACLGETWTEAAERSSAGYVVLHHATQPISITLSTDRTDEHKHVVRLILFVRKN